MPIQQEKFISEHDFLMLLQAATAARKNLFDERHQTALRLFNGFLEGCPAIVIELYARTAVIFNYADNPVQAQSLIETAKEFLQTALPWLAAIVIKTRNTNNAAERCGQIVLGEKLDDKVREQGVWYAVDLLLNLDTGLYLDTRNLRAWLRAQMAGKRVLNTFAYTGSLGVAAHASGAARVVHLDLSRKFLNVAKRSYTLNGFPIVKSDFIAADFFTQTSRWKRAGERFDCVLLDPPFFSTTSKGRVDLVNESHRLINKVRPLIEDGGYLVSINNALFVSGADYHGMLMELCQDGYLTIEELIPVPTDFTGYDETRTGTPPADPSPFNYSTKIAILKVKRKL